MRRASTTPRRRQKGMRVLNLERSCVWGRARGHYEHGGMVVRSQALVRLQVAPANGAPCSPHANPRPYQALCRNLAENF